MLLKCLWVGESLCTTNIITWYKSLCNSKIVIQYNNQIVKTTSNCYMVQKLLLSSKYLRSNKTVPGRKNRCVVVKSLCDIKSLSDCKIITF